ncbi:MAG: ribosomal protein S18-alanine N-acetyltransferase [Dehalococcoidia bacterium]
MESSNAYHIRDMADRDIPQALEIDLDAFPSQWPHPTASSFHHELRNKLAHYVVICRGGDDTADDNGHHVIGLREIASFLRQLFSPGRGFGPSDPPAAGEYLVGMAGIWMMVDEAHIVTIAVRRSHRHQGLGEWLLISIIELARKLRAKYVTLEVRESNRTAQALYAKYGFTKAGTRRKYYSDNGEDALIMTTCELDSPSYLERLQSLRQEHHDRLSRCAA